MTQHHFNIDIAEKAGIEAAILYENICFWIAKNKANGKNFIDGYYWTYNSWDAWQELFPYMKKYTIKSALLKLREQGFIEWDSGINPNDKWDKTAYYRLSEESNIDIGENQSSGEDKVNHHNSTDNKPYDNRGKPTEQQVIDEAYRQGISKEIATKFYLHYESTGWRNVLDFVPKLRLWNMNEKKMNPKKQSSRKVVNAEDLKVING